MDSQEKIIPKRASFCIGLILGGLVGGLIFFLLFFFLKAPISPLTSTPSLYPIPKDMHPILVATQKEKTLSSKTETFPGKDTSFMGLEKEGIPLTPLMKNAHPPKYSKQERVSVALVFVGSGLDINILTKALEKLPKQVAFSFAPYASHVSDWILEVHRRGHEVLLDLPLESLEYPQLNKGPYTLLAGVPKDENLSRLSLILNKGKEAIVGLYGFMGSRIMTSEKDMLPILKRLKKKGYMFLGVKTPSSCLEDIIKTLKVPYAQNDQFLDDVISEDHIKKSLKMLEDKARKNGVAVGITRLHEISLESIETWIKTLNEQEINLIPITAVALYQQKSSS